MVEKNEQKITKPHFLFLRTILLIATMVSTPTTATSPSGVSEVLPLGFLLYDIPHRRLKRRYIDCEYSGHTHPRDRQ
jgi:hypothetical protein